MTGTELKELDEKDLPGRVKLLAVRAWDELMVDKLKDAYETRTGRKMQSAARLTVDYMMAYRAAQGRRKRPSRRATEEWVHKVLDALVD